MSNTPLARNASMHEVPNTDTSRPLTGTAGEALLADTAWYISGGLLYNFDGTEAHAALIVGVGSLAVAMGATGTYYPNGTTPTTVATMTVGEVYAKDDGSLVASGGLTTGGTKYTRTLGQARSTTSLIVELGPVFLIP